MISSSVFIKSFILDRRVQLYSAVCLVVVLMWDHLVELRSMLIA